MGKAGYQMIAKKSLLVNIKLWFNFDLNFYFRKSKLAVLLIKHLHNMNFKGAEFDTFENNKRQDQSKLSQQ